MTISKSLSIPGIAALPLAALTAAAFFNSGDPQGRTGDLPPVPARVSEIREKVTTELQGKPAAETAADTDPAGFRDKPDGPAAKQHPYSTASLLAEADAAAKGVDLERTTRAIASLADHSIIPVNLRADVGTRKKRLERHATWLKNRAVAAEALRLADETMRAPASIPNATKATDTLDDLRRRMPNVAKADTVADEPGDALTVEEADEASRLRQWASYRIGFLSLQAKQGALETSSPDALKSLVEGWDGFLTTYGRPGVADPDAYVAEAKRLRTKARLSFLWKTAVAQDTPDTLAPAVLAWLDEPRANGDADRRGHAASLMKAWLERHLPKPPEPPGGLAGNPDIEEGIVDNGEDGKRVIAIFEPAPGQPGRYRWWYTAAEREDPTKTLGVASSFLKQAPARPKCIAWAKRYRESRDAYLAGFTSDDGRFAMECRKLAKECRDHMKLPAVDSKDVTAPVKEWTKLFLDAAEQAEKFQRACRDSGLLDRIRTQTP